MSRFLFWSDLHCEHAPFEIPTPACQIGATEGAPGRDEIDAILVAGDTDVRGAHVDRLLEIWEKWRVPVLAVAGNHEPYGAKRYQKLVSNEGEALADARSRGADIQVMRQDCRIIGDTRIIGATLWTDMLLYPERSEYARQVIKDEMNDYRYVRWYDDRRGIYRKMIPEDTVSMHHSDRDYIFDRLDEPFSGKTLVMTHHLPIRQIMNEDRARQALTSDAAYASDLWQRISCRKVDAWISGHSHDCKEASLTGDHGPVAFISNPRGYPGELTRFNPVRILDTSVPLRGSSLDKDEGNEPDHRNGCQP